MNETVILQTGLSLLGYSSEPRVYISEQFKVYNQAAVGSNPASATSWQFVCGCRDVEQKRAVAAFAFTLIKIKQWSLQLPS